MYNPVLTKSNVSACTLDERLAGVLGQLRPDVLLILIRAATRGTSRRTLAPGRDARLAGLVRVTCVETIASQILAPCLAGLH
jgi:hypothetical protein